ncbi:MAG TPA: hypothetical protein VD838_12700, partial [Anaeromyxobacteraceae bacterium]|nr:hypothetical protein [Anaeromyxobacteraceae bacterium]
TDVYALGVLLYELLAGRRPYTLAGRTAAEAERLVCETAPARPSTVAVWGAEMTSPALRRRLRGDLDTVVLKALEKEPERRYPSAEALADDLRRFLDGLPVHARPATPGYRLRTFVRRHRVSMAAAVAVAVALVGGLGVALWQARVAERERDHARAAAALANAEAARAEAVSGFLEGILRAPNGNWYVEGRAKGPDTPIRAVIDEAAGRVAGDFADRPDLRADLHHLLGDTYFALGLEAEGRRHHQTVLALRDSLYDPPHPALAEALFYASVRHPDLAARVRLLRRAITMQRARPEGNNFPFMVESLADLALDAGRVVEADALVSEGVAFVETRF